MESPPTDMGLVMDGHVLLAPVLLLPNYSAASCSLPCCLAKVACPSKQALGLGPHSSDAESPAVSMEEHSPLVVGDSSADVPAVGLGFQAGQLGQQVMHMLASLTKLPKNQALELSQ